MSFKFKRYDVVPSRNSDGSYFVADMKTTRPYAINLTKPEAEELAKRLNS